MFVLQGSPGLPSLAALHSNQILTVKVCLVDFDAAAPLSPTLRPTNAPHSPQNCAVGFDDPAAKIKATLCSGHTSNRRLLRASAQVCPAALALAPVLAVPQIDSCVRDAAPWWLVCPGAAGSD